MKKPHTCVALIILIPLLSFVPSSGNAQSQSANRDAEDLFNLGLRYRIGIGVPQDYSKAASFFLEASKFGHSNAQYELAFMYKDGLGVDQNDHEAIKWLTQAAYKGHVRAQYHLAQIYESGDGVHADLEKAIFLYDMAAKAGDASSQYRLALMYENGKGVQQDYNRAFDLYLQAANNDYVHAQHALGIMLKEGRGIKKNPVLAQKWFIIASERWRDLLSVQEKNRLHNELSPQEQEEAKSLAELWLRENKPKQQTPGGK